LETFNAENHRLFPSQSQCYVVPPERSFLVGIESTHSIFRLALVRREICQRLFALLNDRLFYPLASWLDAHLEWLRSHIQSVAMNELAYDSEHEM
jgi:hypothetical protein